MKKRSIALMLVMVMVLTTLLSACGGGTTPAKKEEKVLTVASNMNMTTTEPWKSTTDGDYYIFYQIYSRLVQTDFRGNYYPDLADSWECADDGVTWTFHLEKNFPWQRGNDLFGNDLVQVTADDVKATLEYVMDPANACTRLDDLASTIASIEVVDDKTIKIVTKDIDVLLLYKMAAICIMPKKGIDEGWDFASKPVGSGAFKWDSNIVDTQVVLVANEDYYIKPNIDKVIYKFVTETSVAAMALANKEVDFVTYFAYNEMPTIQGHDFIEVYSGSSTCRWAAMNVTYDLFKDVRVRRAIASYIDMDALVAAVYPDDGTGVVQAVRAYGQIPPENAGGDQERAKKVTPPYDPAAGDKLMEEAGWKKNAKGIWEKDGQTFTFDIQVGTNDPIRLNCSVLMATMLNDAGFECQSKAVEWGTHLSDLSAGNCAMYIVGGYSGVDGPMKVMHTDNTGSFSPNPGYSNPEVDALLEKAWKTTDDDARAELIMQAQEKWLYDTVFLPMYHAYNFQAYNKDKVKDFFVNGCTNIEFNLVSELRNVDVDMSK
ncbi:MAG: ABC transporter substrate-binding protein [Firmicutes bacterium]|nr:ABC transporter substrate-binding protein [Bacillota bacterium]MBR0522589.1 ABC transporter substrate-binding protein [Bacillota bacterium]